MKYILKSITMSVLILITIGLTNCGQQGNNGGALINSAASRAFVPPGEHDEFYAFVSGGYSGQLSIYGLPSGRLFRVVPVFSVDAEKAYGFNEETKPMLNTSFGSVPWDDAHHPDLSQTAGKADGRWCFIKANNTPRIARISLASFETEEIIEIPNSAGNHSSSFVTENTEYVVAGTRFSVPVPQQDLPIDQYKGNFKGALSFLKVDPSTGRMDLSFQVMICLLYTSPSPRDQRGSRMPSSA